MYVKDINDILNKITRALTGEKGKFELKYYPFVPYDADYQENAKKAFKRAEESDFKHKQTSIGIHREDISISLNGRDIATFGSQGENRIAALALKLSPYFLIEDKDKKPIIVLDDVMSESVFFSVNRQQGQPAGDNSMTGSIRIRRTPENGLDPPLLLLFQP